jgi:hypothetical protein
VKIDVVGLEGNVVGFSLLIENTGASVQYQATKASRLESKTVGRELRRSQSQMVNRTYLMDLDRRAKGLVVLQKHRIVLVHGTG